MFSVSRGIYPFVVFGLFVILVPELSSHHVLYQTRQLVLRNAGADGAQTRPYLLKKL